MRTGELTVGLVEVVAELWTFPGSSDSLYIVSAPSPSFVERLRTGDGTAVNELTAALYRELRRIASRQLRSERADHTLQATALVHEAYLKLSDSRDTFADQAHFLAVACRVMRQVLIDYARGRATQKRSGGVNPNQLITTNLELASDTGVELIDLIELDSALEALASEDERLARLIEMRYFGGMTAEESAEALGISVHIVRHDLRFAQVWLRRRLQHG